MSLQNLRKQGILNYPYLSTNSLSLEQKGTQKCLGDGTQKTETFVLPDTSLHQEGDPS